MPGIGLGFGLSNRRSAKQPNNERVSFGQSPTFMSGTNGDWFVDGANGNDGNLGNSVAAPFATIAAAVNAADNAGGDQIVRVRGDGHRYREAIDYIWKGVSPNSLKIASYGSERPVISGAEVLTGWVGCDNSDAPILGDAWTNCFKTTVAKMDFPAPDLYATLVREGGQLLTICGLRDPASSTPEFYIDSTDLCFRGDENAGLSFTTDTDGHYETIAHPALLSAYSDAQLEKAIAVLWKTPNFHDWIAVESVSAGVLQLSANDADPQANIGGGAYALLNLLPNIQQGQWGYVDNDDGSVTFFVFPNDPIHLSQDVELAVRTEGLRVYRQNSDTALTIEGINFEMFARVENDGFALSLDGLSNLTGSTSNVRHCSFRQFAAEKAIEIKAQEQGVVMEDITISQGLGFGIQAVGTQTNPNVGARFSRCLAQDLSQAGYRMFGMHECIMKDIRAERTSAGGHANAINFYQGCDRVVVLNYQGATGFDDRLFAGYATNQRASNIYWLHSTFTPHPADGRCYDDQTNPTTPEQPNIGEGGGLINCWGVDMPDRRNINRDRGGFYLGTPDMPWSVYNSVTPAILNTGGSVDRKGNILTFSSAGEDETETVLDATDIFADPANFDFLARPNSPLLSAQGQDCTAIIQQLESWFPGENFRRDALGQPWDPSTPGVGPFASQWETGGEDYVPPPEPPADPTEYLVQGSSTGYFADPSAIPEGTNRVTFRGKFFWPAGSLADFQKVFAILSLGGDLETRTNDFRATVEDGTNTITLASAMFNSGAVAEEKWIDVVFDIDQVAQTATLFANGTPFVLPFTTASNGVFQTTRPVSFLAVSNGTKPVAQGVRSADLSLDFNGVLHKAISNDPAIANADPWHKGGELLGNP
ncbi:MAG: hypothetical protein ABJN35_06190 [Erythrobacter sp.]